MIAACTLQEYKHVWYWLRNITKMHRIGLEMCETLRNKTTLNGAKY